LLPGEAAFAVPAPAGEPALRSGGGSARAALATASVAATKQTRAALIDGY
jgi:hypothetical protein